MMDQKIAFAGLAIVVAQLSTNLGAALGKSLFPLVGPEGVAALRTGIAALILLAISQPWRIVLTKRQTAFPCTLRNRGVGPVPDRLCHRR
jgi:inner membrane transporter RhtA